jgi:hypothetical protein
MFDTNEIESLFHRHAGDRVKAIEALAAHDIDGENIPDLGFVQATNEIAILLREKGEPVDILFFHIDSGEYRTALDEPSTVWAGFDNLSAPIVRLNVNIHEWLSDSCSGVVNIARFYRGHIADLAQADSIVCSDVHTALQAHNWSRIETDRFKIDSTGHNEVLHAEMVERYQETRDRLPQEWLFSIPPTPIHTPNLRPSGPTPAGDIVADSRSHALALLHELFIWPAIDSLPVETIDVEEGIWIVPDVTQTPTEEEKRHDRLIARTVVQARRNGESRIFVDQSDKELVSSVAFQVAKSAAKRAA